MSLKDLERLYDEYDGLVYIRKNIKKITDAFGDESETVSEDSLRLRKTVIRDTVSVLKRGKEMITICDEDDSFEDLLGLAAMRINDFLEAACIISGAYLSGSGRGRGGMGMGRPRHVTMEEYKQSKRKAERAIDDFYEEADAIKDLPKPKPKTPSPAPAPKPKTPSPKQNNKTARCPRGTRRNKKTGNCESTTGRAPVATVVDAVVPATQKMKRCPRGSHRNKKTGNCDKK